jgi:hypothetical protein
MAAPQKQQLRPWTALSVYVEDEAASQLTIQPLGQTASAIDTLSIHLDLGKVSVAPAAPRHGTPQHEALAVLGLCKLHAGAWGHHHHVHTDIVKQHLLCLFKHGVMLDEILVQQSCSRTLQAMR